MKINEAASWLFFISFSSFISFPHVVVKCQLYASTPARQCSAMQCIFFTFTFAFFFFFFNKVLVDVLIKFLLSCILRKYYGHVKFSTSFSVFRFEAL